MFFLNLAEQIRPKQRWKKAVVVFLACFVFIIYSAEHLFVFEPNVVIETNGPIERSVKVNVNNPLKQAESEQGKCDQLAQVYELLGVVLDSTSALALVKVIESGVTLLVNKADLGQLTLSSAELTQAEFYSDGCRFTLFLH